MYILLIIIGIALIALNIKAIKKEKNSFNSAMIKAESDTDEVDMKIMEMRSEFGKTITELQREIMDLKSSYDLVVDKDLKSSKDTKDEEELFKYNEDKISEYTENFVDKVSSEWDKKHEEHDNKKYINTLVETIKTFDDEIQLTNQNNELKGENKDCNPRKDVGTNSLKVEDVKELLHQGISDDEIAQRLNIGKGEVLLIKELYLR
ncbi:hypothetical protein [Clostridium sp.]|uniref:hypothetical protein n=1 Tax=Clostridium sp. TaxID=1506 RepID=UPI0032162745